MFFLWWFWIFSLAMTFIIWFYYDEYKKESDCLAYLIAFVSIGNMFMLIQITITILVLYMSPHEPFVENAISYRTDSLLKCAADKIPFMQTNFIKIQKCLRMVDIYFVRNGLLTPNLRMIPDAFVIASDLKSVFVSSLFEKMSDTNKALVMIHECAHHALGAIDHAYIWQPLYKNLTKEQHLNNADSYMELVINYCVKNTPFNNAVAF
jgi:hypothetical protein